MIYVKYLMAISEKVFIKWWILGLDIWTFWRRLIVVVCMMPLMLTISITGSRTSHTSWDRRYWRMGYLSIFQVMAYAWGLSL